MDIPGGVGETVSSGPVDLLHPASPSPQAAEAKR